MTPSACVLISVERDIWTRGLQLTCVMGRSSLGARHVKANTIINYGRFNEGCARERAGSVSHRDSDGSDGEGGLLPTKRVKSLGIQVYMQGTQM